MEFPTESVIIAVSNFGGFLIIGKWLMKSVEKTNEVVPVMVENLKTLNESVKELFKSRNEHEVKIATITTGIELCPNCNSHKHQRKTDKET